MDSFDDPSEMTPEQRLAELAGILASAFEPRGFPRFVTSEPELHRNSSCGAGGRDTRRHQNALERLTFRQ